MAKLGYTFYPKDWNDSDKVFGMDLNQRAVYRELIDRAMLSENKVPITFKSWARRWGCEEQLLVDIISQLNNIGAIIINVDETISVPSCNTRIKLANRSRSNGKKGGRKPSEKPKINPELTHKEPKANLEKTQIEPEKKRKERENKRKEKKDKGFSIFLSNYPKSPKDFILCKENWECLELSERSNSIDYMQSYISKTDPQYLFNPENYLSQRAWKPFMPVKVDYENLAR